MCAFFKNCRASLDMLIECLYIPDNAITGSDNRIPFTELNIHPITTIRKEFCIIFPAALGPGVYSASNRNEYQKHKNNNVSGE
jgi:hypothetical protein